jgi:hypothetical protein
MHADGCQRAEEFMPTLETLAAAVPTLAFGRVSTEAHPETRVAASTGVMLGAPALKAFFRNAPPNKRMSPKHEHVEPAANNHCAFERCSDDARSQRAGVLEYAGPPHLEAVLAWAKAVDAWDGSDKIPVGWEVGKREDLPADDSLKTAKGNAKASSSSSTGTGGSASGSKADPEKDEV